jgi:hypothetical protein
MASRHRTWRRCAPCRARGRAAPGEGPGVGGTWTIGPRRPRGARAATRARRCRPEARQSLGWASGSEPWSGLVRGAGRRVSPSAPGDGAATGAVAMGTVHRCTGAWAPPSARSHGAAASAIKLTPGAGNRMHAGAIASHRAPGDGQPRQSSAVCVQIPYALAPWEATVSHFDHHLGGYFVYFARRGRLHIFSHDCLTWLDGPAPRGSRPPPRVRCVRRSVCVKKTGFSPFFNEMPALC